MLKKTHTLLPFFCCLGIVYGIWAQPNTEVFITSLSYSDDAIRIGSPLNISNNDGYDNQPSFYSDNVLLFAATRNGQTDIATYHIRDKEISWVSNTPDGGEYSPLKIPNTTEVSAIRLDTDGTQLLYRYDLDLGNPKTVVENLKVGYHVWHKPTMVVAAVLVADRMDLVVSNLTDGSNTIMQKKVGRSLHKIPNSKLVSFISKEQEVWEIKSVDPVSGATQKIANTLEGAEDMCWLHNGTMLMGKGSILYKYHPQKDTDWVMVKDFKSEGITNITRLTVNATSSKLALVGEISPEGLLKKRFEAYNAKNTAALLATMSDSIRLYAFPHTLVADGKESMRSSFSTNIKNAPDLKSKILNRIIQGNTVIEDEIITEKGTDIHVVEIHETHAGKINRITFITENDSIPSNPKHIASIIDQQLKAYNARDIEAFLATYHEDVKLYQYPNQLFVEGKKAMREGYQGFFEATPNLYAALKNRIIIGNYSIDQEWVTANEGAFGAIAIYEVAEGKICKVTFIQ